MKPKIYFLYIHLGESYNIAFIANQKVKLNSSHEKYQFKGNATKSANNKLFL